MNCKIIDTGSGDAQHNMDVDAHLLESLEDTPILHLYDWTAPSATYGHFIQPERFLYQDRLSRWNLQLARRPTGGGILFHGSDFTFSFLLPASHPDFSMNTLENYHFVNHLVIGLLSQFQVANYTLLPEPPPAVQGAEKHFCMAHPTQYDVIWNGCKIGGAAQRRTKKGFLHQGSISLLSPSLDMLQDLLIDERTITAAMQQNSKALLPSNADLTTAKAQLNTLFRSIWK